MQITEKKRLYNRRWYEAHKEQQQEKARERHRKNAVHIREYGIIYRQTHKEELYEKNRAKKRNLKIKALTHYGKNKLACVRCGFVDIRALSIDHINGEGYKHRKIGKAKLGSSFYRQLKDQGYPEGYQTLCMNCQWIKRFENNEN